MNEWKRDNPKAEKALTPVVRAHIVDMQDEIRRLRVESELLNSDRSPLSSTKNDDSYARHSETRQGGGPLSASSPKRHSTPTRIGRDVPDPVPVALIAKLALDRGLQGHGLGR